MVKITNYRNILGIGESGVDNILQLNGSGRQYIHPNEGDKKGFWEFNKETYFAFIIDPTTNSKIIKIFAGKKWPEIFLDEKYTLENKDVGFKTEIEYSPSAWQQIINDPNAIIGHDHNVQMGGTLRNTLEALLNISTHINHIPATNLELLLLGGDGKTTAAYESHLHGFNDELPKGKIDVTILKDPKWATHQSYIFKGTTSLTDEHEKNAFRTLIRYQEKQKSFDPAIIRAWFLQNMDSLHLRDIIYINSLKNEGFMNEVVNAMKEYKGKLIVAPTDEMYKKGKEQTNYLMGKAKVIICNMDEASYFVTGNKDTKGLSEKEKKAIVIELSKRTGNGRLYVSDGEYSPYATTNHGTLSTPNITLYSHAPFSGVKSISKINAGDTWTARILMNELYSMPEITKTLYNATAYASCFVARPFSNDPVTGEMLNAFLSKYEKPLFTMERVN